MAGLPGCQGAVSTSTGRVKMSCSRDIAPKGITLSTKVPIPYIYSATAGTGEVCLVEAVKIFHPEFPVAFLGGCVQ